MQGMELQLSNLVVILSLVLIVVGLVFAIFWYFKRAENLTDDDQLHIDRAKVAWIGAAATGIFALVLAKKEKYLNLSWGTKNGGRSGASSGSSSLL